MALMPRRKPPAKPVELMLVPMIDIFSVMVTFLLMTAVFSRISIIQLDLPSAAASAPSEPTFRLEVIVRKEGLELTNGQDTIAVLPVEKGAYPLQKLSLLAADLKGQHVEVDTASVLMAPDVAYDHLVQVMDAVRSTDLATANSHGFTGAPDENGRISMFPKVAVGDAP
ncbi:ExbD/TolR family protein [Lysobacter terrae]